MEPAPRPWWVQAPLPGPPNDLVAASNFRVLSGVDPAQGRAWAAAPSPTPAAQSQGAKLRQRLSAAPSIIHSGFFFVATEHQIHTGLFFCVLFFTRRSSTVFGWGFFAAATDKPAFKQPRYPWGVPASAWDGCQANGLSLHQSSSHSRCNGTETPARGSNQRPAPLPSDCGRAEQRQKGTMKCHMKTPHRARPPMLH
jgi:hypothetical protein